MVPPNICSKLLLHTSHDLNKKLGMVYFIKDFLRTQTYAMKFGKGMEAA